MDPDKLASTLDDIAKSLRRIATSLEKLEVSALTYDLPRVPDELDLRAEAKIEALMRDITGKPKAER